MEKPSFYAILPANVRYDKSLVPMARLLYAEITCMCSKEGYCWARNSYFASLYEVSEKTITTWIKSLENGGYIYITYEYKSSEKNKDGTVNKNAVYKERKLYIDESIYNNHVNEIVTNKNVTNKNVTNKNVRTIILQENNNNIKENNNIKSKILEKPKTYSKKQQQFISKLDNIILEYDFSEKEIEAIYRFFDDKLEKGKYEATGYIRGQFNQLAKLSEKQSLESIEKSITNGWNSMYYAPNDNQKSKKLDDGVSRLDEELSKEELEERNRLREKQKAKNEKLLARYNKED